MGLSAERLRADLDSLAAIEPAFGAAIARAGYPEPRIRARGHETLLRTIVGQQVSYKAADAVWRRIEAALGGDAGATTAWAAASDEVLRAAGLSRQKMGYSRSLCALVDSGELDLANLPADDEAAIARMVRVKGIGRWSAEIYLLFAEGRPDIWPAGDLAVQIEIGRILAMDGRPSEKTTREVAAAWRPYRGAAAIFAWHHYGTAMAVI